MEDKNLLQPNTPLYDSQYVIEKNIGKGGDGYVYTVHHKDNPSLKFAAKVFKKPEKMTDDYWRKRGDEALTAIRISQKENPNLAKTYDVFVTDEDQIVFIMEYIDGITLRSYLNDHKCISPKVALTIFKKMLNGIKQLHHYKQSIIHRDLKPENVMVSHDLSKVVIVDFGISTVVTKDLDQNKIMTEETELFGTESYMLPDLPKEYSKKEGTKNISVQSDFFSLGVILYEMIMGELPFGRVLDDEGYVDKIKTIRLPLRYDMFNISSNPTIPTSLENIIYRCIASKPNEVKYRYSDIDEIIEDVNKCFPLLDTKSDPTPLLKPVNQRLYRTYSLIDIDNVKMGQKWYKQWWFFILVFIAAVALIVVAIIYFFII